MNYKCGKYIYWTKEEENKLKHLISLNKYSLEQISSHFSDRTRTSLQRKSMKLGLENNFIRKLYSHNIDFWKEINPITCYFAGFCTSDGHLVKEIYNFILSLASKDLCQLELLKKITKFTGGITSYERKNYKKETMKQVSTLSIAGCQEWYKDLEKIWGIIPQKTYRINLPKLDSEYLQFCWLIGYLDGDGWLTISSKKQNRIRIGFASCSPEILQYVKNIIDKKFNKIYKVGSLPSSFGYFKKKNKCNYWNYMIDGVRAAIIVDYLKEFLIPKLDRKWGKNKIIECLNITKQKHPQIFTETLTIPPEWQNWDYKKHYSLETPQIEKKEEINLSFPPVSPIISCNDILTENLCQKIN